MRINPLLRSTLTLSFLMAISDSQMEEVLGQEVALTVSSPTDSSIAISVSSTESYKVNADANGKFSIPVTMLQRGEILIAFVNDQGKTA